MDAGQPPRLLCMCIASEKNMPSMIKLGIAEIMMPARDVFIFYYASWAMRFVLS